MMALFGVHGQKDSGWRRAMRMIELVSIPDRLEELCEVCFYDCKSLSRYIWRVFFIEVDRQGGIKWIWRALDSYSRWCRGGSCEASPRHNRLAKS